MTTVPAGARTATPGATGLVGATSRLGPRERRAALARMREETFDVLVIGGGVTGTGAALDAATRGLTVACVEMRDWAAGTSSRSSKLVHGGLRYLEQRNVALVREALRERSLLLRRICPHLVKPVPFLFPLTHRAWERLYVGAGVFLYDRLGGGRALTGHRHLTKRRALELFPSLREDALVGAIQYHDGQVDDARHTMTMARTAARYGAATATSVRVVGLLRETDGAHGGPGGGGTDESARVTGARVHDLETGEELDLRARSTISAAGVWSEEIQRLAGRAGLTVRPSKGVHVLVPRDRIRSTTGLILRTERSVLFVIPWARTHWIIGTTDTEWDLDLAHPAANAADIDYILDHVNAVLREPIGHDDIEGVYAGLRPLMVRQTGGDTDTTKISREHSVVEPAPGLHIVSGGKYTTYRVMAEDAVDAAVKGMGRRAPPSPTEEVLLVGADGYRALWNQRGALARETGLPVDRVEHLLNRYGALVHELFALIAERPALAEPIEGADGYLAVEASYAASHEGALHVNDVLTRRTHASIETADRGAAAAEPVARLMGEALGWDEDTVRREVDAYRARVEAERESQRQPDDAAADAVRRRGPDPRDAEDVAAGV